MSERKRTAVELALVCAVGAALYVPAMWTRDLWPPLEDLYAEVSHEIVTSGDWLTLHQNSGPYYNKPPVFFWLEAASIKAFGMHAAAARLPSALLGIGTLVLCYLIAKRLGISPLISSLVLATSWEFFTACHRATIDITLTFFILLAFWLYLLSAGAVRFGWAYFAGAALAAGAGLLTKGPVALLVLICAAFPYFLWRGEWRAALHWKWIAGLLVAAAVGLAWLLPAAQHQGPALIKELIYGQVLSRMTPSFERTGPFYYYLANFPVMFLPWFVYFPMAAWHAWKERDGGAFRALLWFGTAFVAFSLCPPKWSRYILPLYPAAAMMVAAYLSRKDSWAGLFALGALGAGSIGVIVVLSLRGAAGYGVAFGLPVLACSVAGFILWRRLGYRAVIAVTVAAFVLFPLTLYPYRNASMSARPLAMFLKSEGAPPGKIVWFQRYEPSVAFYLGYTQMPFADEMSSLSDYPGAWVIAREQEAEMKPEVFGQATPVAQFEFERQQHYVYKVPPAPSPAPGGPL